MDAPLNGKNTVNDLIARVNDLTLSVDTATEGAISGPGIAVTDKLVSFADTTGQILKQASNVSDFAYTILDDADQSAMQTTLGIKSAGLLDATPNNTANQVVQRDSSGNFSANLITSAVRGQSSREFYSGSAGLYHWQDVAGYVNGGSAVTGTMKITLPVGWTNTMMSIIVRGYNYQGTGGAYEYTFSGYNLASAWARPQVLVSGNAPTLSPIRFGFDGTKACILIGDVTTSWAYPRLAITDVITSYAAANTGWDAGWVIAPITDETGITVSGTVYPNTVVHATSLEVGKADGSSGFATIDFHGGGATRVDYDARIGVNQGTGVLGGGTMSIYSSYLNLKTTAFVSSTTPAVDTNNTQVATTAYVLGQGSTSNPPMDGVAAPGTSLRFSKADHVHPSDTSKVDVSKLGVANGVATLDANALIPTTQLPAYVDDVLEFANLAAFPGAGVSGKIYVALDTNKTYRWSGSVYIYITSGAVDSVAGKTGVVTLVKGDVGLGSVDNTSDVNKPVSTAQQTALDLKAPLASPTFTGTPLAPTASVGTSTTQVATTAFVNAEIANDAPTKTGGGASGSWGISVTGSSASCSGLAASATTLTGLTPTVTELNYVDGVTSAIQTQLDGKAPLTGAGTSGSWPISVTGNAARARPQRSDNSSWDLLWSNPGGQPTYYLGSTDGATVRPYEISVMAVASCSGNAGTATKLATARTINGVPFDGTANISIAAGETDRLPLTGGAVTGKTSFTKTGQTSYDTAAVEIGAQSGAAYIGFHRHGAFGGLFGVDTGNNFYGNSGLTMTGNITAYSDIRLKTDIEVISDALNKVCTLRGVTYTRIEGNERQTGVIAQEVQAVLPEAVKIGEDVDQTLSVAYGNLVGLLIEAIKELKAEVDELKQGAK